MRCSAKSISLSSELRVLEKTMEQRIYQHSKETVVKMLITLVFSRTGNLLG